MNDSSTRGVTMAARCDARHSDAVRRTVMAPHPSDQRELEVCFYCPRASRYRELPRLTDYLPITNPQ